jgi:hypothetical protein
MIWKSGNSNSTFSLLSESLAHVCVEHVRAFANLFYRGEHSTDGNSAVPRTSGAFNTLVRVFAKGASRARFCKRGISCAFLQKGHLVRLKAF